MYGDGRPGSCLNSNSRSDNSGAFDSWGLGLLVLLGGQEALPLGPVAQLLALMICRDSYAGVNVDICMCMCAYAFMYNYVNIKI